MFASDSSLEPADEAEFLVEGGKKLEQAMHIVRELLEAVCSKPRLDLKSFELAWGQREKLDDLFKENYS